MIIREAEIADAAGIAYVHTSSWLTTYRGIMPDEKLDSLNCEDCEKKWLRNIQNSFEGKEILLVAEMNGQIVGFCGGSMNDDPNTKEKYANDLRVIYILQEYQKQGIGRKLVSKYVSMIIDQGIDSMIIWVLEDNISKEFYVKLGGIKVAEKDFEACGKKLKCAGYGWENFNE
ncbi:MAG: GNAT family N-acetyltransferase [Candidatus Delongbacteria bacterium]|nr:GNAT family N-acetyltransferase [Candidatus Delongbacteria bacterium]MCG2759763.1 GNAT family N-acetyltransferase [Candidatus Delongbacteria bacterium]